MYLGSWKIDDYVPIPATCHRFSTGAAYAPTVLTYSIYEDGGTTGIDEDVDMTPASPFDGVVGFYLARRQLTAAAGFEKGKNYTVLVKATVDSVAGITAHTFQIEAEVDANVVSGTPGDSAGVTEILTRVPDATAGAAGGLTICGSNAATTFATLSVTGQLDAGNVLVDTTTALTGAVTTGAITAASASITGQLDAGNVLVDTTTALTGAVTTGAITAASASITGQLDAGNVLVDTTTVLTGAVSTGAVTLASEAITGAFSVGTTTTLTGAVSAPAGIAAAITGNITGNLSGSVGTIAANGIAETSFTTGSIAARAFAAGAIDSNAIADGAIDAGAIADAAIDNATFAADVGTTAYASNRIALACDKALVTQNLDHLCAVATAAADMTAEVVDGSVISRMVSNSDTSTYVPSTDSLHVLVGSLASADTIATAVRDKAIAGAAANSVGAAISDILTDTGTTLDGKVNDIKTKTDYLPSATAGAAGGLTIAGSNAATTFATLTSTGAFTAGSSSFGNTTFGTIGTGAVTKASEAITGALSVGTTTTLTGAVSAPAGIAANITGNLSGSVGSCSLLGANAVAVGSVAADAITASALAIDAVAEIVDAVWDEPAAGHNSGDKAGTRVFVDVPAILDDTGTAGVAVAAASKTGYALSATQTFNNTGTWTGSVGSIATGGITAASIASDAITDAKIATGAITAAKFAANAITSTVVADNTLTAAKLAADCITAAKIADAAIDNATFAADVGSTIFASNTIAQAVDKTIAQHNLDHLCGTASGIPSVVSGTWLDMVMDDGTATYDRTTDSLQAIRDNMAGADAAAIADAVWDELETGHVSAGKAGARLWTDIPAILVDTGTTLDTNVTAIKTKTDYLPSATAGAAGGVTIAGSNAATTFATLTSTGALTAGSMSVTGQLDVGNLLVDTTTALTGAVTTGAVTKASESITGQWDAGNVLVDTTTALTGAVTTGAVTKASESITGQFDAGNVLVDTTTVLTGAVSTGAVTKASEAITGALSVGTTTTLTGAVSAPAGITADITGSLSGSVGTVTLLSANAVAVGSIATDAITAGSIAADAIGASELAAAAANEIADAILDRADAVETGLTPRGALRLCSAASSGTLAGAGTTTVTIKNAVADSKARITATVDSDGNRSSVSTDVT